MIGTGLARRLLSAAALTLCIAGAHAQPGGPVAAEAPSLQAAQGGRVLALVVGMDQYRTLPVLRGAVADARDIERTLRRLGAADVTLLLDAAATRAALTAAVARLIGEARRGDLVILAFAGHGSQEPARVPTKDNGGYDEVFMLAGFAGKGAATAERIRDKEIFGWLAALKDKGAATLFVADTCHGGGMSKEIDRRIGVVYRSTRLAASQAEADASRGAYFIADDQLPATTREQEASAAEEIDGLTFVGAVDRWSKAPEIVVADEPTLRGAASFAFARALEGHADADGDGVTTRRELIAYVRSKVSELTERGQDPILAPLDRLDERLFTTSAARIAVASAERSSPMQRGSGIAESRGASIAPPDAGPVRLGVVNGPVPTASARDVSLVSAGAADAGFDAIWDARNGDVVSSLGDVVARGVTTTQIGGVVERLTAVRKLAALSRASRAELALEPNKRTYRKGETARLSIRGVDGRYLIVANVAGDGRLQRVYPLQGDEPLILSGGTGKPLGEIVIKPPFGSDVLVAVVSKTRLVALEQLLIRRDEQRGAREFAAALAALVPDQAQISMLSLFSEP